MVSARYQPMGIKKIRQAPCDDRQKAQQKDPVVSMRNKLIMLSTVLLLVFLGVAAAFSLI